MKVRDAPPAKGAGPGAGADARSGTGVGLGPAADLGHGAGAGVGAGLGERPGAGIIGPTPPPYHGMSIFPRQILASPALRAAYELVHLDTADRRSSDNMGRFELTNIVLGVSHAARLALLLLY